MKNLNKKIQQILTIVALLFITNTNYAQVILINGCNAPLNDTVTSITGNKAIISWESNIISLACGIRVRVTRTTTWTNFIVAGSTSFKQLNGLTPLTKYQYKLLTYCDSARTVYSDYSIMKTFTTLCNCDVPSDLNSSGVSSDSATLNWTGNDCAVKYRLQYRVNGSSAWTQKIVDAPSSTKIITTLLNNTSYQYRLRSDGNSDGSIHSNWSAMQTFNTSLRMEDVKAIPSMNTLNIFPNPSNGNIVLIINSSINENATLRITDALGKEVLTEELPLNEGENNFDLALNDLATGIYMVRFESLHGIVYNKLLLNK